MIVVAAAIAGCANKPGASTPPPPATSTLTPSTEPGLPTVADKNTRACVLRTSRALEGSSSAGPPITLVSVESLGKVGQTWIERWTVESKGRRVTYSVKLRPGAEGDVDFDVERLVTTSKR